MPNIDNFLFNDTEEDQAEFDADGNQVKFNQSKFFFSGLSFKNYVGSIHEKLNDDLKILVKTFISQKQTKHHQVHLTQKTLQVKHPIFKLISGNAFKWIIDRAFLFKLKKGQAAYRQGISAMKKVYIVMYG